VQNPAIRGRLLNDRTLELPGAALRGSSYLKLAPVLRFCTGNIGYHVPNAQIYNYGQSPRRRLRSAVDTIAHRRFTDQAQALRRENRTARQLPRRAG
jgi:hypothetical protein